MSDRIKKIIRAALFAGLVFESALAFAYVVRQSTYRIHRTMFPSFYAEPADSLDIIGIGSSAAYRYIDTPVLYEKCGYTSFNVGTPLQPTSIVPYLMNEVEKSQKPDLYIVEVREYLRLKESEITQAVYCASDSMDLSLNKLAMVVRAYETWPERYEAWLDIAKYHGNWEFIGEEALTYWRNRVRNKSKEWSNIAKIEPQTEPEKRDEAEEPLYEHNEKALRELLEDCKKKNRQVLFLMTPYIYGEKISGRLKTLRKMVESYGYKLLDFSRGSEIGLDYSLDFYNTHHVNWRGAEKMTLALGDYIKKEYNIDAQHTQEVRDDWDAYAARNREESDKLTGEEDAGFDDSLEE